MTRVDQVELVRHASDAIDSLLVDVHHSTVVVPRLDHSWITARKRELRLSDFPVQSPLRERERGSSYRKERLNIFVKFFSSYRRFICDEFVGIWGEKLKESIHTYVFYFLIVRIEQL